MTKLTLERNQVWLYLIMIAIGLAVGSMLPAVSRPLEMAIWPVLCLLLYATFTQIRLAELPRAFRDTRFLGAAVIGNFLFVPLLVWGLVQWLPDDPVLRLGVLLVLLVPCTDWFIAFSQLGRGDVQRAIAVTPLNLLLQILLLPVYLWLFMDINQFTPAEHASRLGIAFAVLILLPLLLAALTEWHAQQHPDRPGWPARLEILPVPLLAVVVFLIAASQASTVLDSLAVLSHVMLIFMVYLVAAAMLAWLIAGMFRLDTAAGRTLAFSLGTRNSFVVLPLALALPAGWEVAVVVIVCQSLVELFGMSLYLWWVPQKLFPAPGERLNG